jgi:hypothetical protein
MSKPKRALAKHGGSDPVRGHPLGRDYALQSVFAMFNPSYRGQQGVLAVPLRVVEGEPPELHLLSPNEDALQRVKEILATPGARIEGFAIDPPPDRDVQRWGRALSGRGGLPELPPGLDVPAHVEPSSDSGRDSQPSDDAPFVLRIREGRDVVHEAGPFERVTQAIDARDEWGGAEQGMVATIYDGSHVADYRGDRATFKYGRTRWSRAV